MQITKLPEFRISMEGKGHSGDIRCLAFSPSSTMLVSASDDKTIIIWETAIIWEAATLKQVRVIKKSMLNKGHTDAINSTIYLSHARFATAGVDKTIKVWEEKSGELVSDLSPNAGAVYCLAVSRDGSIFASGHADATLRIYNTLSFAALRTIKCANSVTSLCFVGNELICAGILNSELATYSVINSTVHTKYTKHEGDVWGLCVAKMTSRIDVPLGSCSSLLPS